jgi:hypothetical protein
MLRVPVAHDLGQVAAVQASHLVAHLFDEVTEKRWARRRKRRVVVIDKPSRDWFIPKTSFAMMPNLYSGEFCNGRIINWCRAGRETQTPLC